MNMSEKKNLMPLVERLGELLVSQNQFLCTAESCTGGGIAALITSLAGSSAWFDRAYVTYSNAAKISMLGVTETSLREHGAVSEQVAQEMATGALKNSGTDFAVSVTGIAGPGGGTPEKPVGTVCFAWTNGGDCRSQTKLFPGDRAAVRSASVEFALVSLIELASGG